MSDGMSALFGYIISWLPMAVILWIYVYFGMKLVRVQRTSAAALEKIARTLGDIDARLARGAEERPGKEAIR